MSKLDNEQTPGSLYFYGCSLGAEILDLQDCINGNSNLTEQACNDLFYNSFFYSFSSLMVFSNIRHSKAYMNTSLTAIYKTQDREYITMGWGKPATHPQTPDPKWRVVNYGNVNLVEVDIVLNKIGTAINYVE